MSLKAAKVRLRLQEEEEEKKKAQSAGGEYHRQASAVSSVSDKRAEETENEQNTLPKVRKPAQMRVATENRPGMNDVRLSQERAKTMRTLSAAPAALTEDQKKAASDWATWNKTFSSMVERSGMSEEDYLKSNPDVAEDLDEVRTEVLGRTGLRQIPASERLRAAAEAGNAASKQSALQEQKKNQKLADMYSTYLSQVEEMAERNGQTVEEYLKGDGAAYVQLLEDDEELQSGKAAYETRAEGGIVSPTLDKIQQRQLDTYQGTASDLESPEMLALLDQGHTGEWLAQWNRVYEQTAAQYIQKAQALQEMRMSGAASRSAIETAQDELDELDRQLTNLKAISVMGNSDFAQNAKADAALFATDADYWAVNNPAESRYVTVDQRQDLPSQLNAGWAEGYERRIYNYLYKTQGKQAAQEYLSSISNRLQYRKASEEERQTALTAQEHPVLSSAASLAASALETPAAALTVGAALTGQEVNPYSDIYAPTRDKTTIRSTVGENIGNSMLNMLYQAGMSMGDNLVAMGTGGGMVGTASLQMAGSALGATAYDTMIRGGSTQDAALAGGAAAITEYLTEKAGFDRITQSWTLGAGAKGYKGALAQFVKGFIPEGLEEVPGNFVESAVDEYLMGGNSKRNKRITALIDQGATLDQAMSQADAEFVGDVVMSFFAGGLAGGTMEAGSYIGGVHQAKSLAKDMAKEEAEQTGVDRKDLQKVHEMELGVREVDQEKVDSVNAQLEEAAETAARSVSSAKATVNGEETTVAGIESAGEEVRVRIRHADGTEESASMADVTFDSAEARRAYEAAAHYQEDGAAQAFLSGWESSRDTLDNYRRGFDAAYTAGYTNRPLTGSARTWTDAMDKAAYNAAYKAGQRAQRAQEARLDMDADVDALVRRTVMHMPRAAVDGYSGAINQVSGKLTSFQATQMAVADYIGRKYGLTYTFVDSASDVTGMSSITSEGVQGAYTTGTNQIVIALDAQESALLSVVGHETLHYVKEWSSAHETTRGMYEDFQSFILQKLEETDGYDLETRIQEKVEQYRRAGAALDREGAIEEIVADSMVTVFATEKNMQEFLESHDQSIVEKVISTLKRLLKEIKAAIQRIAKNNAEAAAMLKQDADTIQDIADRFDRLAVMAGAVRESVGAETQTSAEGTKYQLKPYSDHQRENWKNSKLIQIYENEQQLRAFISNSLSDPSFRSKMYFGQVDERLAEKIKKAADINILGYNLALYSYEITKILKDHGDSKKETPRGQRAITTEDLLKIREIVQNPDQIILSKDLYEDHKAVMFVKDIDGRHTVVAYAVPKKFDLHIQTMYIGKRKKSLAPVKDAKASLNATSNDVDTSMTSRGTAPDNIISDSSENSNGKQKFSMSSQIETENSVYEQYRAESDRLREVQEAEIRLTKSAEFLDVMDLIDKDPAAGTKAYRELLKKYGLDKGGSAAIQKKVNELYRRYQKLEREEAARGEQSAIEKSGKSAADWHRSEAVKAFGYTSDYVDAGYMLPNGKMLNFSGEKGKHFGVRGDDHRAIGQVFADMSGSEAMLAFMHEGNIRMMPESPGIDIASSVSPTTQQYTAIRKFAAEYGARGSFSVDFTDENGREAGSLFYNGNVRPDRVVNDIKHYFETGEIRSQGASEFLYSLRDVDTTNDEMARLLRENGELRALVNQLSAQVKGKDGAMLDSAAVRQLARSFKEDSGTRVPLKTLTDNLQTAFTAMANATTSAQSSAAMEMMGSIAKDMLEKSTYANRELYDQYEEMRKYFKGGIALTSKQWQEVKKVYGSNSAFRQATASLLKVKAESAGGVTLDNKWGELCERWPAFFREDVNEGDQVASVLAALEAVQITYENPYGDNLNDYANDLAVLMYQEYMNTPEVKDRKTRQIEKLSRELDEARASIRSQAAQVRKLGKLEARIQEYRDAAHGRYVRQAQRRKDNQDYGKMRAQVIRQRDQLMKKLLEPKVGAFVPQSMHDAVMELIRSVDFEGRLEGFTDKKQRRVLRAENINRAKEEYLAMARPDAENARGPFAAFVNGDLEADFDLLAREADGMAARDLSMKHMEALRNIVAGYTAAVVNADRLFMQQRRDSLSAAGDEMAAGMYMRKERMKQGKAAEYMRKATSKGLLKPVTVFHQFKGTPMEDVWKALRDAENVHIRNVNEAETFLNEALEKYHLRESIRKEGSAGKRKAAVEVTLDDGSKMQLTDQELMTLYATFEREKRVGTNHLLGGGFTLANTPAGTSTKPTRITGLTLQEILDKHLSKEQKAFVDHMVGYLSSTCADWGNEVTLQLYGVEKFREEYYIPFSVNKNYIAQEPATEQDSRLKTGSFTKALTAKASAPIEIKPFTELWCEHVEKMSDYNAFVLPIEDMTRLMNYKTDGETIRALMKRYHSPESAEYIMNFLSRLNGNSRNEAGGSWLNAFMGKAKAAAVTFNASVAIQQAGSASRAMALIDPKYFIGGTGKAFFHKGSISASYQEAEKYAPIAVLKSWGYFDTNMARGLYNRAQGKWQDKVSDFGGKLAEVGDRATWARIWEAVKLETADRQPDLTKGSEEFFQACADRFTEVIDSTQVVDSVFQRAEWATEKGLMKAQMSFMSEPLTMYNMVYRAVWDLANSWNDKTARARAMRTVYRTGAAITLSSAVTAALKSFVSALRDRDNEEKDEEGNITGVRGYWDKYLDALDDNFMENMLGIGSIFTNLVQGAFSYYSSDLTTQCLADFAGALMEAQKGADADWTKVAYKTARGLSSATGYGFSNAWRDGQALYHTIDEAVNRDNLAGAAWDTSLPFETRLAAAEKNYVMVKQGDGRKVNTGIYYDLMLAAYFESGLGDDYQAVVDAAIRTGGSDSMWQSFKKKLRTAEDRIPQAAAALVEGDMTTYARLYEELQQGGIGERAIASMIISEVEALTPKEEEPVSSESILSELRRNDVDTDPVTKVQNQAYNAAVASEDPQELKAAVDAMRKNGASDDELRKRVKTSFRKSYCWAVWQGDTKVSTHAANMMKGAGVGIDNADLKDWASKPSGSYASDTLHELLREGDSKQAHTIHKYLVSVNGSTAVSDALKRWCKTSIKGSKHEDTVRAALKQMGYAPSTIESWFR